MFSLQTNFRVQDTSFASKLVTYNTKPCLQDRSALCAKSQKVSAFTGANLRHMRAQTRISERNIVTKATADDSEDEAVQVQGDWREFRANLVAQSQMEESLKTMEGTDEEEVVEKMREVDQKARIKAASGQNMELLKKQLPDLAENMPWAHSIPLAEKGCLLVANENLFSLSQQYFHQAVIFLIEHNDRGSMGIILNRPTTYTLGQVTDKAGPFHDNPVYFGGDVGDGAVSLIHGNQDVRDSLMIRPGLYLGGMESAAETVEAGLADPQEFKFFARYAGWGPGQLEAEVENGVWYCAASSRELVLKPVIQLPKPLWREILELMGDEYSEASWRTYNDMQ